MFRLTSQSILLALPLGQGSEVIDCHSFMGDKHS